MNFIVGLGNPGKEYQHTRHNLGFMLLDQLATKLELSYSLQKKFFSEIAKKNELLLVKPQTYMNESGTAVRAALSFYQELQKGSVEPATYSQLFVVFDDLDIPVGSYKIQLGTGPKVHNGLSSIYSHIHTKQFWHVRLGADGRNGDRAVSPRDYVLSGFSQEEQALLKNTFDQVATEVLKKIGVQ